jgi:hypothetical protein
LFPQLAFPFLNPCDHSPISPISPDGTHIKPFGHQGTKDDKQEEQKRSHNKAHFLNVNDLQLEFVISDAGVEQLLFEAFD